MRGQWVGRFSVAWGLLSLLGALPAFASGHGHDRPGHGHDRPGHGQQGPNAISFPFIHEDALPHGVAIDGQLAFIALPLVQTVSVVDRFTGRQVGTLPAPPGGFGLPFAMKVASPGHVVLLDSGSFPNPLVPSVASVDDYSYHFNPFTRHFTATLDRTVSMAGLPLVFAEDVAVVSPDLYVVSESVIGALWLVHGDGSVTPGIFPDNPAQPIPALGGCPVANFDIGGVPFEPGFAPGVNSLAVRGGQLYLTSSCLGGLYRIPVASLLDDSRPPSARADDIVTVSARPAGAVEALEGLAFDKQSPSDPWVYTGDPFHLRLIRIDVNTGARQVVGDDPTLYNFPVSVAFAPKLFGTRSLLVVSDQEYRLAALNPGISQDELQPPFWVTAVVLGP